MSSNKAFRIRGRVVGTLRRFAYPRQFVTLPDYTAHAGQSVRVLRRLTEQEADRGADLERMYWVRTRGGWEGAAFESEIARKVKS